MFTGSCVTGSVLKCLTASSEVYEESKEGKDEEDEELKHKLPALEAGQKLTLKELKPEQHFTERCLRAATKHR